ncbi:CCR2, partial [Symbiodinium pilosum]
AELKDGSQVAVKAIDLAAVVGAGDNPEDAGFDEEVMMLSKFRHPNLVTLLGWGSHGSSRYLVYELLSGGDLFRRLHKSRSQTPTPFPWHERLSVCLDAATGLSHMHNSTPKAFHRDIKSANILLDRHGTAKMADFG